MGAYFLEPSAYQALTLAVSELVKVSEAQKFETIGIESKKLSKKIDKFIKSFERSRFESKFKPTLSEWRVGRNFIRDEDLVKVKPSKPNVRDGFKARVKCIEVDRPLSDKVILVHVTNLKTGGSHSVVPERIQRVAQSRARNGKA